MKYSSTYHISLVLKGTFLIFFMVALSFNPVQAQKTSGKKLRTSEKASTAKMDDDKVKTSKRREVKRLKPGKWNWNKIMWFKAKKSDYKTNEYNPDKKTKYKQYDNDPNYKTESRGPGDSDVKLRDPLIPFDSRIADEGPVLRKKREIKGMKKGADKKLYTKRDEEKRKPMDNDRLEMAKRPDYSDTKMDDKKLMVSSPPDYESNKMDDEKLLTIKVDRDKPKPFDDKKLMTVEVPRNKKQTLHDDRLLVDVPKIERAKVHGDKLLTVKEVQYPSSIMKRVSEDIAKHDGNSERYINITKDSHPGSLYMSSKGYKLPWLKRTQIAVSLFWSGLWDSNIQPKYVTEKKPKHRRDKKEGKIWDNSVHPDEWRNAEPKPESGESN